MTVDAPGRGRVRLNEGLRYLRAFAADGLALFGFVLLFGLYVIPRVLNPNFFVLIPNAFIVGLLLAVGSMVFVGWAAFRRTRMDVLFCLWILLATASHFWAVAELNRTLNEFVLYNYVVFIATMWVCFRVGFALTRATPAFAPYAILSAVIFTLLLSATLGILQGVGPVKQAAIDLGLRFSGSEANVLEGAEGGRPTGVFGGPNILGYANVIGAICLVGIGLANARAAKAWQVALIMAGLGLFGYSTLLAQSRISLAVYVVTVLAYGLALRRFAAPRPAVVAYVALLFGVIGVGAVGFRVAKLEYVTGTFQNEITKDSSYLIRQEALRQAGEIAVEIAPLGTGTGQINQQSLLYERGYDRYWTLGVDNEWVNIYLTHGVLGPLFLAVYYLFGFYGAARARRSPWAAGRTMGYVATACLVANLAISFTGVRLAKYETALYANVILGSAFAAGAPFPAFRRRRPAPAPDVAAA